MEWTVNTLQRCISIFWQIVTILISIASFQIVFFLQLYDNLVAGQRHSMTLFKDREGEAVKLEKPFSR